MKIEPFDSRTGINFRDVIKGNNFMTPRILGYVNLKNGIAEISTGAKFLDLDMFGVTIVKHGVKSNHDSKCFNSMEDVIKYIGDLNYENHDCLINLLNKVQ
jgi:hypothetical protein